MGPASPSRDAGPRHRLCQGVVGLVTHAIGQPRCEQRDDWLSMGSTVTQGYDGAQQIVEPHELGIRPSPSAEQHERHQRTEHDDAEEPLKTG